MLNRADIKKGIDLFLIGFIALYFEMLFIRWVPSSIQVTSYFPNLILISSFLGLGIGCLLAGIRFSLAYLFIPLVLNMVFLLKKLAMIPIHTQFIKTEYLQGFYRDYGMSFLFIAIIVFVLNAIIFIPVGQKTGSCLKYFKPLIAYSINIAGGIAGIILFSVLSYFQLAPFYWFLLGLVPAFWFYASSAEHLIFQGVVVIVVLYNVLTISLGSHWSPYYKVDIAPSVSPRSHKTLGLTVLTNNSNCQYAYNLSDASVVLLPELRQHKDIYEFPYNFIQPKDVLILGAGCGNDTAAALRKGVKDISAVEIDPYIASLGKTEHPEKPYKSDAVHLYIDDARAFIKRADRKFDLIIFGYLDAQRVLSQFSSVRLDSFVYTEEAFGDVKNILSQDGMVAVTCLLPKDWIGPKIYSTMKKVFGDNLKVFMASAFRKDDTAIFLAGPGVKNVSAVSPNFKPYGGLVYTTASVINDDKPYLYLKPGSIPLHYVIMMIAVLIISFISVFYIAPEPFQKPDGHFFFLGAGFMLLETIGITRSALLFGSTWIVNSAVMISVLCVILLASLYVSKTTKLNIDIIYALLAVSIILNWMIRPDFYLTLQKPAGMILSSFVLSLPLLFAGIIFFNSFREATNIPTAFAFNIFGAVLGGTCEYISMITGFGFVFLLAAGMYALSYISRMSEKKPV